jgi:hypothetical protein
MFQLCSNCFTDQGLRLDAEKIGIVNDTSCENCQSTNAAKLTGDLLEQLAYRFFVRGSIVRTGFGGAPRIQFNKDHKTDLRTSLALRSDIKLFEKTIGVGFFYYGPPLWMIGEIEPLKALKQPLTRDQVIKDILEKYPTRRMVQGDVFYRLRKAPNMPDQESEYDSPPIQFAGSGRLDSNGFPVLYGSQDLEVCVHECRVTVEDELYLASLTPKEDLRLLDLTALIEENSTAFESLDMAVHMLFLAGGHAYEITRAIALEAHKAGFDGLLYPSYFSLVRTGAVPSATAHGISIRKLPTHLEHAKSQVIPNIGIFGRPIEQGRVAVSCINRLILNKVVYDVQFGPVKF